MNVALLLAEADHSLERLVFGFFWNNEIINSFTNI